MWRWYATLGMFYGVHLALLFYVVMLLRELVSVRHAFARMDQRAAAGVAVGGGRGGGRDADVAQPRGFPMVFDETAARRFTFGAGATTASAVVLLGIAVAHYSFGRRGSRVGAALLVIAITGSLALPIAARGWRRPNGRSAPRRVTLAQPPPHEIARASRSLLLDGASLEYVWPRVAAGRLPNFGRLLDSRRLDGSRDHPPDAARSRVGGGRDRDVSVRRTACARRPPISPPATIDPLDLLPEPLFLARPRAPRRGPRPAELVGRLARAAALVDPQRLRDQLGDRPLAADLSGAAADGIPRHRSLSPVDRIDVRVRRPTAYPLEIVPVARDAFAGSGTNSTDAPTAAARWDEFYGRTLRDLESRSARCSSPPCATRASTRSATSTCATPSRAISATSPTRIASATAGCSIATTRRSTARSAPRWNACRPVTCCWSSRGSACSRSARSSKWRRACFAILTSAARTRTRPDGFVLAYGTTVAPGRKQRGSIVDVTPTILYFLGVPIGRDMDGYARADLFTAPFMSARPITYIPSHGR